MIWLFIVLLLVELHRRGLLGLDQRGLAHALHVEVLELLEGLNVIICNVM